MIRSARIDDAEAIARVQVDTWRSNYPGIVPDERLANLDYSRSAEKWRQVLTPGGETRLFVAEDESGQVSLGAIKQALGVHPDAPDPKEQRHRVDGDITLEIVHYSDSEDDADQGTA